MNICFVEDHSFKELYPLTKTRPVFGLRCGKYTIEDRILTFFPGEIEQISYIVRPEIEQVCKKKSQDPDKVSFNIPEREPCLLLNGKVLFEEATISRILSKIDEQAPAIWLCENTWAAVFLPEVETGFDIYNLIEGNIDLSIFPNQKYLDVPIINYPWDLVQHNSRMIRKDYSSLEKRLTRLKYPPLPGQVAVLRGDNLMIGSNVDIYPFVTLDCSRGPIIIGDNVTVESGAFIQGPVSIEDNCLISANTKIYRNTTLGDTCKVGGEISHSIIHGFSNKRHSGFLGNSYIGKWVNLGAGTNNSNMKNNYNKISVSRDGEEIETGSQFIGLFMGDHSRSAISTRFNTATFVGVGCNIFGNGIPPKEIPDFTWGGIESFDLYDFQKFVENANRMMIRREVQLSNEEKTLLKSLHRCRSVVREHEKVQTNGSP